jgi:hypothetical protein
METCPGGGDDERQNQKALTNVIAVAEASV